MKFNFCKRFFLFVPALFALLITGCINTKKAVYFNDLNNTTITSKTPVPETIIQKNDLLNISVSSLDAKASEVFNAPNVLNVTTGGSSAEILGYLVGTDGTIQFPILGSIMAEGLSKEQLRQLIQKKLTDQDLLKGPIVSIRFINFRVTVLGEVKSPTVINVPNEKISLLEAIGLAGDLTIYAKRDNILVIRENENGDKDIKRINLNSIELLSSPYYYLKSNDIVYVEPNKSKIASTGRGQQWVPAVLSGLSLVAIIVDRVVK
ncbi:MAG: polysaccharide biosynthesis/export family protein [Chitinophagales bacterium]